MVVMLVLVLLMGALHHFFHHIFQLVRTFNGFQNCLTLQLLPRGGNNGSLLVVLPNQLDTGVEFFLRNIAGSAQDNGSCKLNLVNEKLTKVLDIHLALACIHNRYRTVDFHIQIACHILNRTQHV